MLVDVGKLEQSFKQVKKGIEAASIEAGRQASEIRLVAVSKSQPAEKIRGLVSLGQAEFGENFAQELLVKAEELKDLAIRWIYIGPLQSNKISKIVKISHEIQSVTTEKHIRYVSRYAKEFGKIPFPIYIEVNIGEEDAKHGLLMTDAQPFADIIKNSFSEELDLQGIMVIPPARYQDEIYSGKIPEVYKEAKALARKIGRGKLSLGMSGDLRMAIQAGTDCLRIGTAIFGDR